MVYTDSYTGTEGNPVNRRSLKRQRSIRSKETQWKSVASGGQPTQVRIQALEPRAEQIQTVGTENVESFLIESRVYTGTEGNPVNQAPSSVFHSLHLPSS